MSTDTADGETEQSVSEPARRVPTRRRVEEVLLVLTGLLGAMMIAFIAVDWLRTFPGAVGALAQTGFEQFLIAGEWADYYLGTNVFQYPFMWRAIATGVLVGIVGPLVGTYLVHRQMALIGETLAHTAFAGVAIGIVVVGALGLNATNGRLVLVALVVSVLSALGLQWLTEHTDSYGDVPIAIVLTGSFAVGTLLISWGREFVSVPIDIEQFLFGDMAVVTAEGARIVAVLSVVVVALVAFNYKQFLFITFDETAARVARFNVTWYNALLVTMTAVVVVGAMQILGVILVAGLLVIPVAAASQIAQGFRETLYLSVLFGQTAILAGIGLAIWQSLPSGGSVIVVAIAIYLVTVALSDRSAALTTR
ncbi:metal ABC transporter permease [Natronoarchaeum sp. GCM10025321]|uniref:metal ABC transporter permease n=1 Tax=Natronoarchaeum sp. GCM10025321 TaxID=3252684 RepID=UPI0036203B34